MKVFLAIYLVSVIIILIAIFDCGKIIRREIGKPLYKAWCRRKRNNDSIIRTLKNYLILFLPIINTVFALVIFLAFDDILTEFLESVKRDCESYGIDFEKSKNAESEDYIVSLEELEGIKRADSKVSDTDSVVKVFKDFL